MLRRFARGWLARGQFRGRRRDAARHSLWPHLATRSVSSLRFLKARQAAPVEAITEHSIGNVDIVLQSIQVDGDNGCYDIVLAPGEFDEGPPEEGEAGRP